MKNIKISVLSRKKKINNGFDTLYPLYRYHNELKAEGLDIEILYNHNSLHKRHPDIYVLCGRYFQRFESKQFAVDYINKLKESGSKIVWFDTVDPSGCDTFEVIPFVDIFLKKQIWKDKSKYALNEKDKSVRPWLDQLPEVIRYPGYIPCPEEHLHKIKVGWNIGLCSYKYYAKRINFINNFIFKNPRKISVHNERNIDIVFRGNLHNNKVEISVQRNNVIKELGKIKSEHTPLNIILGKRITYKKYLKEFANSKLSVSPFGWGEICYRDFESILAGTILLKPKMDHIDTFPDVFSEECYVPISWDLSDLTKKVIECIDNYKYYKEIAINAQNKYYKYVTDPSLFIGHFKTVLEI